MRLIKYIGVPGGLFSVTMPGGTTYAFGPDQNGDFVSDLADDDAANLLSTRPDDFQDITG